MVPYVVVFVPFASIDGCYTAKLLCGDSAHCALQSRHVETIFTNHNIHASNANDFVFFRFHAQHDIYWCPVSRLVTFSQSQGHCCGKVC